jgi:predicted transcriptional regulator
MAPTELRRIIEAVGTWPEDAQAEAVALLQDIERELQQPYELTDEDRASIERGLADAKAGRFASDREMQELFARYRLP